MANRVVTGLLVAGALAANGCYHYRVAPARSVPADDGHSTTLHSIAWGLVQSRAEEPECQGNGAAEVAAHTNLGFALLSVVTLGIWVPLELEWKCAKDPVRVESGME
jgi:Bor protein